MKKKNGPKVLLFDIETFPNVAYTWGKWEQNVIRFVKEWELASFAYKWLDQDKVTCVSRNTLTEKQIVEQLWNLFNEADVLVAHNGDQFDIKKAKAKFIQFKMKPPALNKSVDTKKIAKSQFSFNSNSLNDLGETLGLGKKIDTGGFDLWLGCMSGDKRAWKLMEKYNIQDVRLLQKVYLKFRSWMPNHPSLAALQNKKGCPVCASIKVQCRGFTTTPKNKQQRYVCLSCGKWYTGKIAE